MKLDSCTADTEPCANENTNRTSVPLARWSQPGVIIISARACVIQLSPHATSITYSTQPSLEWLYSKYSINDAYFAWNINLNRLGLFGLDYVTCSCTIYCSALRNGSDPTTTTQKPAHAILVFFLARRTRAEESDVFPSGRAEPYNSLYRCAV
jgi:hypothetical protein